MKAVSKLVFLNDQDEKFFGEGPCKLLRLVDEMGSLHAAAQSMGMAYTKALKILKNAEKVLGFPLTSRIIGGKNGGGSSLTSDGRAWLERYEAYCEACRKANDELYRRYFPRAGCVIMASGIGKRFGGNKLMTDFCGQPMICCILKATEGLFDGRIVVTRHEDVACLCREWSVDVILHDLPLRSDAVRLGLEAMKDMDGCMFCLGDQPLLRRETVAKMVRRWEENSESIWRAECGGILGSPVIFPKWAFEDLMNLPDGYGGGYVLKQFPERICSVSISDAYELKDVDVPQDLEFLQGICRNSGGYL